MADLNNIDAEIKALKQQTESNLSLLASERKVQEALLYSTGARKKYTNALTAAAELHGNLAKKEREQEEALKSNSGAMVASMGIHKKLKNEQVKLLKVQENLRKLHKKNTPEYKKNKQQLNAYHKQLKNSEDAINSYEKAMKNNIDTAKNLRSNTKGLYKVLEDVKKVDSTGFSSQAELNDLTKKRIALLRTEYNIYEKRGDLNSDEAKDLREKLKNAEEMGKVQGDLIKRQVSEDLSPMVDDLTKSAQEKINKKKFGKDPTKELARSRGQAEYSAGFSLKNQQAESLKSIFSGKSSLREKLGAAKSYDAAGKQLKDLDSVMGATGKSAMGTGAKFKMLGAAMSSLGKMGWIGLVIQAVTAVAKAVNELDKFTKGFNQTFAKLHGPTVTLKDAKKAMRDFNTSIFDLQRNLKYGLKSEEIVGMFQAVSESGMSLQGVLNKVSGGYGELIDTAAQIQFDFGVSMEEAGAMLGEQMTDLKSTVNEASASFKVLSYDASIAGIQSQKFYQATYAAAEGLSYYGKFLNSASNTLKNFQQQGGMGFKDAQQQTQTLTNLFKDMDKNSRVAFIEMSGGVEAYRKDFLKLEGDSRKAIEKHTRKIDALRSDLEAAKAKGDKNAIDRLEKEKAAEEDKLTTAEKTMAMAGTAAKSNAQDMAMYLEMISDKSGEKMANYFEELRKKGGPDIFSTDTRAMVEHMKAVLNVSDEFAMKMIGTIQTSKVGIERMAKDMDKFVKTLPDGKDSTFGEDIKKIIMDSKEKGVINMAKVRAGLEQYGKDNKVVTSQIYDALNKYPNTLQYFLEKGYKGVYDNLEDLSLKEQKQVEMINGEGKKEQEKRLDELVRGTHTIEDFLGINAEYTKNLLANNPIQEILANAAIATARTAGSILDFMTSHFGSGAEKAKLEKDKENAAFVGYNITQKKIKEYEYSKAKTKDEKDKLYREIFNLGDLIETSSVGVSKSRLLDAELLAEDKAIKEITKRKEEEAKALAATPTVPGAATGAVKPEGDYKARSGGYALLSKGDVVVNAKNMSSGVGGDLGAFAGTAASDLIRSMPSAFSGAAPQIPVNISIGSVSGDPEQFLNRIKPAIEQAFERMYYDKQKRR